MEDTTKVSDGIITESDDSTVVSANEAIQEKVDTSNELIAGKFKSQEDLVKAYESLQSKMGGEVKEEAPEVDTSVEAVSPNGDIIPGISSEAYDDYANEWANEGSLSEASYAKLEGLGFSKEIVDAHINGNIASGALQEEQLLSTVGGKEAYTEIAGWARDNLSEDEISAYNNITATGSVPEVQLALQGLKARYEGVNGRAPTLSTGMPSGAPTDVFESNDQVTKAIQNPLYKSDPAYRREVQMKLTRSKKNLM